MIRCGSTFLQRRARAAKLWRDHKTDMQSKREASKVGFSFARRFWWQTP